MYTTTEAAQNYCIGAKKRMNQGIFRLLAMSLLAGSFIALAGFGATIGGHLAGKLASGAIFPTGLAMVLLAGSELFTGNSLLVMPLLRGEIRLLSMLRNWLLVYVGNFLGAALTAWMVVGAGVSEDLAGAMLSTAAAKVTLPFGAALLRGILCNFLVCLAVWMSLTAKTAGGKIAALFFPIFLFVLCGFEHSVANMYYIPTGILLAQDGSVTWAGFVHNLLPVTLGNLIGGCGLGVLLYLLHLKNTPRS